MNRIESVEMIRLISIFAVIVIHTTPFLNESSLTGVDIHSVWGVLIKQASTFAVPFFFIISGYFWSRKIHDRNQIFFISLRQCKRLLKILLFWSLIYITPYNFTYTIDYGIIGPFKVLYWNLNDLLSHPFLLLFQGTKGHLWFLMSLIYAVLLTSYFVHRDKVRFLLILSIAFYIFGLLAKGYAETPLGLKVSFNPRSGPTYSIIFFITGYLLSKYKPNINWFYWGGGIFFAGFIIKTIEIYFLWITYHTGLLEDYLIGTLPIGLGVAMMSISMHPVLTKINVIKFSKYTLGIYACHFLFVDILKPLEKLFSNNVFWELNYPLIVFCLSLLTAYLLNKSKFTNQFVV